MSEMADMLHDALMYVAALGLLGHVVFILLYALACLLFFPVSVLTFGAGAVYGVGPGFALVWLGAMLGSCSAFMVGRHWLRAWVERRLASHPVFLAIDAAVSAQGGKVVFLTRLTPVFPFTLLNYAYGVTRVGFGEYAAATSLGMSPGTFLFVYLGAAAGAAVKPDTVGRTNAEWAFFGIGLLATVVVVALVGREAKRALAAGVALKPSGE